MNLQNVCIFFVFVILLAPAVQGQFVNSNLKRSKRRFQTVQVLPARVSLTKVTFKGRSSMPNEADKLGQDLSGVIRGYLSENGVKVLAPLDGTSSVAGRSALADIQGRYDKLEVQILKNPKGIRKGRFTLGDGVASYLPAGNADSLIFIRGNGSVLDHSQKAIGLIPGPWMWLAKDQRFDGRITFVDARIGEVLLLLVFTTYGRGWKQTAEELMPRIKDSIIQTPLRMCDRLGPAAPGR